MSDSDVGLVLARVAVLVYLGACGRLGYDPVGGAADTDATDSTPAVDAAPGGVDSSVADAVDSSVIDAGPLGSFSDPTVIAEISALGFVDDDPSLTGDRLELYFNSDRPGGAGAGDIWLSTRLTTADPWSAPIAVAELNSSSSEGAPEVSTDGLTIHFASSRAGGAGGFDVWVSTRVTRPGAWSTPLHISQLSSTVADASVATNSTMTIAAIDSDRGGINRDLYLATRASTAASWGIPSAITELNTSRDNTDPFLDAQGLVLYYSQRDLGSGGYEIYTATRTTTASPFGAATAVAELNTSDDESDPWLSPDGRHAVFARADNSGDWNIFESVR